MPRSSRSTSIDISKKIYLSKFHNINCLPIALNLNSFPSPTPIHLTKILTKIFGVSCTNQEKMYHIRTSITVMHLTMVYLRNSLLKKKFYLEESNFTNAYPTHSYTLRISSSSSDEPNTQQVVHYKTCKSLCGIYKIITWPCYSRGRYTNLKCGTANWCLCYSTFFKIFST